MNVKNLIKGAFFSVVIILSSCSKSSDDITAIAGCMDQMATNYNASATEDDGSCVYPVDCDGIENGLAMEDDCGVCHKSYVYQGMGVLTTVDTYADTAGLTGGLVLAGSPADVLNNPGWNATCSGYFFYADGYSTVSYSGQTARLNMVAEMMGALANSSTTESMLVGMFDHQAGNADFADADLNASSKQIKSKTAAGLENSLSSAQADAVVARFGVWFADYAENVAPIMDGDENSHPASVNTAGWVGNRELNAKGMEYDQIVAKSLIGALCLDQVVNSYLSPSKLDVDNTLRSPDEDNNATAMEHHWDEAFGYVYGKFGPKNTNGDLSGDGLLGKYLNKFPQWKDDVFNAFKAGREAIVAGDMAARDANADIIKETLSKVTAQKAIDYLESSAAYDDLSADYFHALSEGYGFILSLQFTVSSTGLPYFSHDEVNIMLDALELGNGLWDRSDSELTQMANDIKSVTGL